MAQAQSTGIAGFVRRIPEFFQQVQAERRKVVWPTRKETVTTAVMVVILTVMLGLFFFGVDQLFSRIVKLLLSLLG